MRRWQEKAVLEVGFVEVAEHMAANGYSSITILTMNVTRPSPIEYLRTPLINISNVDNGSVSGNGKNPKQHPRHQYLDTNPQLFLAPEAALHREGSAGTFSQSGSPSSNSEMRKKRRIHISVAKECANKFWESILVFGGFKDDPRNNLTNWGIHSTIPINPYQRNQQELNYPKI